jgi:PAS domain S-box-containing protein
VIDREHPPGQLLRLASMHTAVVEPLAQFIEMLPEPALIVTGEGTVLAANGRVADVLERPIEALVGRPLAALVSEPARAVNDDLVRHAHTRLEPGHLRLRASGPTAVDWQGEAALARPAHDDEAAIYLVRFVRNSPPSPGPEKTTTAANPAGTPPVTPERSWYRRALGSIGDAVIATDKNGVVTFMNGVAERLTGREQSDAVGRSLGSVFQTTHHGAHAVESPVTRALREGVVTRLAQYATLVHRDGTEYTIEDTAAPIRDEEGNTYGVIITFRDVGDRRSLERELGRTADELATAHRRKDEFLAMLAHELRNPLAPLRNGIQILRSLGGEDDQMAQVEEMMERQIAHLTRLVDDLLDVSRITRGLTELHLETVPLRVVLERAIEMTRPIINAHDHELNIALPPESLCVEVDMLRASQMFENLLNNAAEFTPPGGRIAIAGASQGDTVVVNVIDSGIGISEDFMPSVFDLFSQADRSLHRPRGGLGIGLTVVRALVEMHGGKVHAHSEGAGLGSEFVVELPIASRTDAIAESTADGADPEALEDEIPTRILVVDDNIDAAESLALILDLWGHDVRTVASGEEALDVAPGFGPDVVLLDVGLPLMNGFDVARRLRRLPETRNALIVAVTGYGREEDRRNSKESGIDLHLTKPVEPAALKAILSS